MICEPRSKQWIGPLSRALGRYHMSHHEKPVGAEPCLVQRSRRSSDMPATNQPTVLDHAIVYRRFGGEGSTARVSLGKTKAQCRTLTDYEDMPTLSNSRIMTAICARLAASATRVKSLRKTSVEGALTWTGAGGTILLDGDDWTDEAADVCWETGDWTGRSIFAAGGRARTREEGGERGEGRRGRDRDRIDGRYISAALL